MLSLVLMGRVRVRAKIRFRACAKERATVYVSLRPTVGIKDRVRAI